MAGKGIPDVKDMPIAANGEVKAFDRLGNKITVPKEQVGQLYALGGRVARKAEALSEQQQAEHDAKPLAERAVGAVVGTATGPIVGNALAGTGTIAMAPEMQAFQQGEASALTAGLDQVAVMKALEATAGKEAARAYGKHQLEIKEASPGAHTAGAVTGFAVQALGGSVGGAARALPGAGISALGAGAESAVASNLAGLASKGVLGRALATSAELGARGAVEGALYSAANEATEEVLGDKGLAADKIFAAGGHGALLGGFGGAALGGAGSLAKSAVGGTVNAARGGLSRVLGRAEDATAATTEAVAKTGSEVAEATGTKAAQEARTARSLLTDLQSKEGQKGIAYDLAFDSIGRGNGLQPTRFAAKAERYLPNGTRDVGEVMMRKGIVDTDAGLIGAARNGTAADMLPKIEAARAVNAQKLHEMTSANPARITDREIEAAIEKIAKPYDAKAGQHHIADAVREYGLDLRQTLGTAAQGPRSGIVLRTGRDASVQELVNQRKALDELVFKEVKSMDPKMRVDALRDLRSELEGLVVDSFERAGEGLGKEQRALYKALKRDHVALSVAEELATDSAVRNAKGATLGLRDMLAGGSGLKGLALGFAHKTVRERGSATAAVLVHRMAELGTLTKIVRGADDAIGRASQGILSAPKKGPMPELPVGSVRARADAARARVSEAVADPDAYLEKVSRSVEPLAQTAPELAGGLMQKATDYVAFMQAKIPQGPPPDPLDPHPTPPKLTDAEASKLARYDWYWEKPERFFMEVERGHVTFEGIEVAKAAMPGAFAELQAKTAEGLATLAAQGRKPPFAQRQKIGTLLEFPATAAQTAQHMAFLQQNAMLSSHAATQAPPAQKGPIKNIAQRSPLDRLEASGIGR